LKEAHGDQRLSRLKLLQEEQSIMKEHLETLEKKNIKLDEIIEERKKYIKRLDEEEATCKEHALSDEKQKMATNSPLRERTLHSQMVHYRQMNQLLREHIDSRYEAQDEGRKTICSLRLKYLMMITHFLRHVCASRNIKT
jgi:hypothetical protein